MPLRAIKPNARSDREIREERLSVMNLSAYRCLPTFLGLGSMRCGSTWLYEVLKCHPDIRLGDEKEMDFFFVDDMLHKDLDWYEDQFKPNNGDEPKPVRGEISPLYARLKQWQVNRIARLLPNLRIILTLRHPVERAWSQAVYEFGYIDRRNVRQIGAIEFLRQVERARNKLSSDYCRTIQIWANAFGRDALRVDLFETLRDNPEAYINGILQHIGAATPWRLPPDLVQKKVFATNSLVRDELPIPEVVRWYLADRLLKPTEQLNDLLNGMVLHWVEETRTIRGKTRPSWRILKEVNRILLSLPERLAYEGYHAVLDARLWLRWRQLQRSVSPAMNRARAPRYQN